MVEVVAAANMLHERRSQNAAKHKTPRALPETTRRKPTGIVDTHRSAGIARLTGDRCLECKSGLCGVVHVRVYWLHCAVHRLLRHAFISFHFISFHFISFHFISFHFISFHFISFHFISFHFISFHFISFHFISFHFISFHFISFHFISFHFISFHFISFFISFHFISFHFISFHFIHSHADTRPQCLRQHTRDERHTTCSGVRGGAGVCVWSVVAHCFSALGEYRRDVASSGAHRPHPSLREPLRET